MALNKVIEKFIMATGESVETTSIKELAEWAYEQVEDEDKQENKK